MIPALDIIKKNWSYILYVFTFRGELSHLTQHEKVLLGRVNSSYAVKWLNKLPDLIDFCITKGISSNLVKAESSLDLSSDHTPVIVTVFEKYTINENKIYLHSKKTNWTLFRDIVSNSLSLNVSLKWIKKDNGRCRKIIKFRNI